MSELARGVGERGVHLPSLGRSRPLSRTSFSGGQNNLKFTRRLHQPFGRTELSVAGQSFLPGNPCSCPCREGNQKGTLTSTEQKRPERHDYAPARTCGSSPGARGCHQTRPPNEATPCRPTAATSKRCTQTSRRITLTSKPVGAPRKQTHMWDKTIASDKHQRSGLKVRRAPPCH